MRLGDNLEMSRFRFKLPPESIWSVLIWTNLYPVTDIQEMQRVLGIRSTTRKITECVLTEIT